MPNQNKPSVADRIIKGLNTTASVIGAATSLGKTAYSAAKFAAPIVKAIIRMIGNPKAWYLKYGAITPAANENRPMEPIFNTLLTKNATFGVPHFVDVEVAWTDFADTYMMDQVVTNAMRSIRKHLRSNLPYTDELIKAYLVNSVALCVMAKQVERDVHWAQYTATNNPRWQAMYIKKPRTTGTAGIVELVDEDYLSDANWAYTSSIYNKFKDLYNNTVFGPAALGEFISHYFGSLFVSQTDGHNDQYIRLKMQEIDWMIKDGDNWTITKLNVTNLTLDDVMSMLNTFSKQFAIVIADLEKAVSLSATAISSYEQYVYYLVYDESLLQALINGYTSKEGLTNKDYIRLDRMPNVEDDLTQFLFMGALQPDDSSLSNTKAIRLLSMTYKLDSNSELEWPAEFTSKEVVDEDDPIIIKEEPFGIQLISDIMASVTTNIARTDKESKIAIVLDGNPTPDLSDGEVSLFTSVTRGRTVNSGTATFNKVNGKVINYDNAVAYWFLPQGLIYAGDVHAFVAIVVARELPSNFGNNAAATVELSLSDAKLIVFSVDSAFSAECEAIFKGISASGKRGVCYDKEDDVFASAAAHAVSLGNADTNTVYIEESVLASTGYTIYGEIIANRNYWNCSYKATCLTTLIDNPVFEDLNILGSKSGRYNVFFPDGVVGTHYAIVYGTATKELYSSKMTTSLASLAAYAADVFDYHLPFVIKNSYTVRFNGVNDLSYTSSPVLVKENYIPYFYNILDLVPVLYSMFTSLFSFEGKRNDWGNPRSTSNRHGSKGKKKTKTEDEKK